MRLHTCALVTPISVVDPDQKGGDDYKRDACHVTPQCKFIPLLADRAQQVKCRRRSHAVLCDTEVGARDCAVVGRKRVGKQISHEEADEHSKSTKMRDHIAGFVMTVKQARQCLVRREHIAVAPVYVRAHRPVRCG